MPKPESFQKEAEKVSEVAEEVSEDTATVEASAEEAVNSLAAENSSEPDVSAASILPAELASALREPSPEIKIGEAPAPEVVIPAESVEEPIMMKEDPEEESKDEEISEDVKAAESADPDVLDADMEETEITEEAVEPENEAVAEEAESKAEAEEVSEGETPAETEEETVVENKEEASDTPAESESDESVMEEASASTEEKTDDEEASEAESSTEAEGAALLEKKEDSESVEKPEQEETDEDESSDDEKKNEEESAKEKSALYMFFDTLKFVAIGLLIGILLVVFVIQRNDVYGSSMEPTLHTGDAVFVEMISVYTGNFKRGDIVTIDAKGMDGYTHEENLIKRIVGLPGETIKIEDGNVYINGVLLDESAYLPAGTKTYVGAEGQARGYQEITLGPDEYYCMGDNRGGSNDSRRMGPFKKSQIDAKVLARIYPFNKMKFF